MLEILLFLFVVTVVAIVYCILYSLTLPFIIPMFIIGIMAIILSPVGRGLMKLAEIAEKLQKRCSASRYVKRGQVLVEEFQKKSMEYRKKAEN